jgi:DNA-binding transcriptional ArsR family regulator
MGDLVLTEPRALLALAAPSRLRIFDKLRREGPLTPAALSAALDEDGDAVQAALEDFAECGLAFAEDGVWRARESGFVFECQTTRKAKQPRGGSRTRSSFTTSTFRVAGWRTTNRDFPSTGFARQGPSMLVWR